MRIDGYKNTISFQRALTPCEERDYVKVLQQAKDVVGQTGNSILIMPTSSLPQSAEFNSGVGHLSSGIAQDYLKYMQTYYGINVVEDLPAGQVQNVHGLYCAYEGSALELGVHQINPELLATDEFEHLLSREDLKKISDGNTSLIKTEFANFSNVVDKGSESDKALERAFGKFQGLSESSPLKAKYKKFIAENSDWLEFPRSYEPNQDFFKFKQFLAEEHLKIGKAKTNQLGIKLCGDCPIGFSKDEVAAFPNAFYKDKQIKIGEWRVPSLNYDEITNPSSEAYKLLKRKIQLAARRYDMLRMDVGWSYVTPKLTTHSGQVVYQQMQSSLLGLIEKWVRDVKGDYFDTHNIIYEVEAGEDDFKAFGEKGLIAPLQNRLKVYTSQYMHDDGFYDCWGYNKSFLEKGLTPDEYILGTGSHDTQPLRQVAKGVADMYAPSGKQDHKTAAIKVLSMIFGISERTLENPVEFAKAKFAEPMMSKHNMVFFADVFGMKEAFNKHGSNKVVTPEKNFTLKAPVDFKTKLHQAIQKGYGFNIMDSLEKIFVSQGYDKTNPALFKKIVHYNKVLSSTKDGAYQFSKGKMITFGILGVSILSLASLIFLKNNKDTKQIAKNTIEDVQAPLTPRISIDSLLIKNA